MSNQSPDTAVSSPSAHKTRVAVVQAEPVWFDLEGAVQKTIEYISKAAQDGAKLVAFPEVWIPGYPSWIW